MFVVLHVLSFHSFFCGLRCHVNSESLCRCSAQKLIIKWFPTHSTLLVFFFKNGFGQLSDHKKIIFSSAQKQLHFLKSKNFHSLLIIVSYSKMQLQLQSHSLPAPNPRHFDSTQHFNCRLFFVFVFFLNGHHYILKLY